MAVKSQETHLRQLDDRRVAAGERACHLTDNHAPRGRRGPRATVVGCVSVACQLLSEGDNFLSICLEFDLSDGARAGGARYASGLTHARAYAGLAPLISHVLNV